MKKPALLGSDEWATLEGMLPESEPALKLPPARPRIIPVAETLLDGNELQSRSPA